MKLFSNAPLAGAAAVEFAALPLERVASVGVAEIAFGLPAADELVLATQLKWVHIIRAGYERYATEPLWSTLRARGVAFTTSSPVYAQPCAEQALAMMLAACRQLPDAHDNQRGAHAWPSANLRSRAQLLFGARVLVLGGGAIAQALIALLAPFAVDARIVRRAAGAYHASDLPALLPWADHVVNVLPGGDETRNYVSAERIALLREDAHFYNVGRGTTVDEVALAAACVAGKIAGAHLDVAASEPIPPDHPLWTTPRVQITPHIAGGRRDEELAQVKLFADNLARFERGAPLQSRVL